MVRAAHIIDVAVMVHNKQWARLAARGYSPQQALRLVNRRHRGLVGKHVGDTVRVLFPAKNLSGAMARQILDMEQQFSDDGAPITRGEARATVTAWFRGQRASKRNPNKAVADRDPMVSHSALTSAISVEVRRRANQKAQLERAGYAYLGATAVEAPLD